MKYHEAKKLRKGDRVVFECPDRREAGAAFRWNGTVIERKGRSRKNSEEGYVVIRWDDDGEPDDHTETTASESYFFERLHCL
jgi:hypothetical protein